MLPTALGEAEKEPMVRFFGALERACGSRVVAKNKSLAGVCSPGRGSARKRVLHMHGPRPRRPGAVAAKRALEMHGDPTRPYGIDTPNKVKGLDYVDDVADQVVFYERLVREQERLVGRRRFRVVCVMRSCVPSLRSEYEMSRK